MNDKKIKIVATHIENDVVNNYPTLVFTDENGKEWVNEEQSSQHGGYLTVLVEKSKSWYFKSTKES